jgi:hypothetical protein
LAADCERGRSAVGDHDVDGTQLTRLEAA